MPGLEELQTSTKTAAPGWSYVYDLAYDPSKVAINPTSRKRARPTTAAATADFGELTLRQQTAIQRHLAELDRDSHKETTIPTPKTIFPGRKQTLNAKRVLGSGKTFAHYLEEDEAARRHAPTATQQPRAPQEPAPVVPSPHPTAGDKAAAAAQRASKTPLARRKPGWQSAAAASTTATTSKASSPAPATRPAAAAAPKPAAAAPPKSLFQPGTILFQAPPPRVSEAEIEALLAAPMLSYNAARSAPPPPLLEGGRAMRHRVFCEMCGYWGRVRCIKCGARVCGLECREAHDESRCLKFYA